MSLLLTSTLSPLVSDECWIRRVSGHSGNDHLPGLPWNSHSLLPDLGHFKFHLTLMSIKLRQTGPAVSNNDLHRFVFNYRQNIACRIFRSEEHTSELQSQSNLVCRLL